MKLLTWNINGIRATNNATSMKLLLDSLGADIICLQETKITRNLLTHDIANVEGYHAFFSFSKVKNGYSGVATYCKKIFCPVEVEEGLSGILVKDDQSVISHNVIDTFPKETILSLDSEGRAIITEHNIENYNFHITIINVYCPHVDVENVERYTYKLQFNQLLEARYKSLVMAGKHVIIVGDLNISHRRIDHCDPDDDFEKSKARIWFDGLLNGKVEESVLSCNTLDDSGENTDKEITTDIGVTQSVLNSTSLKKNVLNDFIVMKTISNDTCCPSSSSESVNNSEKTFMVDIFRHFNPTTKDAFTCWNTKTRARETNYGTRIDYILSNDKLVPYFKSCCIRPDIMGSDHCPVQCVIGLRVTPPQVLPSLCTSLMPEFLGHQANITTYFSKKHLNDKVVGTDLCCEQNVKLNDEDQILWNKSTISRKRAAEFPSNSVVKSQKINEKKDSKKIANYFQTTETVKKNSESGDNFNRLHSDELWNASNYLSKSDSNSKNSFAKTTWKSILKGPGTLPLCTGHHEPSVLRTVKKQGPNLGRQFYACSKPAGQASNKDARCDYFHWKK